MSVIVPTITASDPHRYREQIELVVPFAQRLHVDFADGRLAPTKLLSLDDAWLPEDKAVDLHLMYERPLDYLSAALKLQPQLIIIHAEAEKAQDAVGELLGGPAKCGVALLPETPVSAIQAYLNKLDHVLIFAGRLGYQGGTADLSQLHKVAEIRRLAPGVEIGWDGGVDDQDTAQLSAAGVNVLNVGGYIQHAENPATAYAKLLALAETAHDQKTEP